MAMALLHETGEEDSNRGVRVLGNLSLNLDNYRVGVAGEVIDLTYSELELLRLFVASPDRVIPYQEITQQIWSDTQRSSLRHLNVLVHRLRAKLGASDPYVIETVRGRGYGLLKSKDAFTPPASENPHPAQREPSAEVS